MCGKTYKDNSGLWRHKKKCLEKEIENNETNEQNESVELIKYLMKENSEFKQLMLEQSKTMTELAKKAGNNNNNNNTTNNNNQHFNLHFYLKS